MMQTGPIVDCEWLSRHKASEDVTVLDASWHLPGTPANTKAGTGPSAARNPKEEFRSGHIPGAYFFDLDRISDQDSALPHMLPKIDEFSLHMRKIGVKNASHVVVYDTGGVRAAARAWWMFTVFGHDRVSVLDGGLERWSDLNLPVEQKEPPETATHFTAPGFREDLVASLDDVSEAIKTHASVILDARGQGRFSGREPEPRPELPSGHMPGARNLYYGDLFKEDGSFRHPDDMQTLLMTRGISATTPVITTCGSGVSACTLALVREVLGHAPTKVYDGSWAEWAGSGDLPIEKDT